ncbi:serine/threonine-protein kinase [Chondromyces crocatus]|uniref:Protein kinase n=1 Tax=Chondromyces crocatus TaxID=52 RepID=A0A0K1EFY4_CHOCO|nr:serine/threonine-protein kinase [Chondromyces crocatus]AKT39785.1 protein kinase [Chondromyces crocatus]
MRDPSHPPDPSPSPAAGAGATVPQEPLPVAVQRDAGPVPTPRDDEASRGHVPPALAPLAGSQPRRTALLSAGAIVDQKYAIERVLGEGGMGVVYLARDVHTGLHVVVKAVRQEIAHRKEMRARMLAEGRALAQIDHPNVVRLNAVVEEGGTLWLVMQYIEGESLDRLIGRRAHEGRPLQLEEALGLFRQVAAGVGAAHGEGVIHRDLKPANVMIRSKDGIAKVTDFGIAKEEADAIAGRGLTRGIIGSLYYMSPEQVIGRRDLDKRVDIYALGILLYEMLVGHVPFDADSDPEIMRKHLDAPLPRVSEQRADVPPELDAFLQRACAKDRADRFASCDALLAALDGFGRRTVTAMSTYGQTYGGAPGGAERTAPGDVYAPPPRAQMASRPPAPATIHGTTGRPPMPTPVDPVRPRSRRALGFVLAALVLAAGAAALLMAGELLPGKRRSGDTAKPVPDPAAVPPEVATHVDAGQEAGAVASPPTLATLSGRWTSNGRDFDAVQAGDALEFRVRDPEQFAPQDYETGEVRFLLRALPDEPDVFAVEDHIRFYPPTGLKFDPKRARGTCQDVRSSAEGRPLRARYDGARLSVEFARIEPAHDKPGVNFIVEGGKVVSCRGLGALAATRVLSVLTR